MDIKFKKEKEFWVSMFMQRALVTFMYFSMRKCDPERKTKYTL